MIFIGLSYNSDKKSTHLKMTVVKLVYLYGHFVLQHGPIMWDQYWDPKLYIDNYVTEPKRTMSRVVEKDINGHMYVLERRRVKG